MLRRLRCDAREVQPRLVGLASTASDLKSGSRRATIADLSRSVWQEAAQNFLYKDLWVDFDEEGTSNDPHELVADHTALGRHVRGIVFNIEVEPASTTEKVLCKVALVLRSSHLFPKLSQIDYFHICGRLAELDIPRSLLPLSKLHMSFVPLTPSSSDKAVSVGDHRHAIARDAALRRLR